MMTNGLITMTDEEWRRAIVESELNVRRVVARLEAAEEECSLRARELALAESALAEEIEEVEVLAECEHEIKRWLDELGEHSMERE